MPLHRQQVARATSRCQASHGGRPIAGLRKQAPWRPPVQRAPVLLLSQSDEIPLGGRKLLPALGSEKMRLRFPAWNHERSGEWVSLIELLVRAPRRPGDPEMATSSAVTPYCDQLREAWRSDGALRAQWSEHMHNIQMEVCLKLHGQIETRRAAPCGPQEAVSARRGS